MIQCKKCGAKVKSTSIFCPFCGEKIDRINENVRFCPTCGNKSKKDDVFCSKCGTKLVKEAAKEKETKNDEAKDVEAEPKKIQNPKKEINSRNVLEKVKINVFLGLIAVSIILVFSSIFGNVVKDINFVSYFEFIIGSSSSNALDFNEESFGVITCLISFIIAVVFALTMLVFLVISIIKSFIKQENIVKPLNIGLFLIGPSLYFLISTNISSFYSINSMNVGAAFGSFDKGDGHTTFIVGLAFLFVSVLVKNVFDAIINKDKKMIPTLIIRGLLMIYSIRLLSNSFRFHLFFQGTLNDGRDVFLTSGNYQLFPYLEEISANEIIYALNSLSMFFVVVAIGLTIANLFSAFKKNLVCKPSNTFNIVNSSILFGTSCLLFLTYVIMIFVFNRQFYDDRFTLRVNDGMSNLIMNSLFVMLLSITDFVLDKKLAKANGR